MSARRVDDNERGTATAFVVGMAITFLACAGLVVDGGTALNARMKLADDVEQAARAGAQELDVATLRGSGAVTLDQGAAARRARGYISRLGYTNAGISVNGTSITVEATDEVETRFLSLIGINSFDISAAATAGAVTQ